MRIVFVNKCLSSKKVQISVKVRTINYKIRISIPRIFIQTTQGFSGSMFKSFFPNPKWFFISVLLWSVLNMTLWYTGGNTWGSAIGWPQGYTNAELPVGVSRFWSPSFLWFYVWFFKGNSFIFLWCKK